MAGSSEKGNLLPSSVKGKFLESIGLKNDFSP
jgi:hypothetical protein